MDDDKWSRSIKNQVAGCVAKYGPEKDGCGIWTHWLDDGWLAAAALVERCCAGVCEPNAMVLIPLPTENR